MSVHITTNSKLFPNNETDYINSTKFKKIHTVCAVDFQKKKMIVYFSAEVLEQHGEKYLKQTVEFENKIYEDE